MKESGDTWVFPERLEIIIVFILNNKIKKYKFNILCTVYNLEGNMLVTLLTNKLSYLLSQLICVTDTDKTNKKHVEATT